MADLLMQQLSSQSLWENLQQITHDGRLPRCLLLKASVITNKKCCHFCVCASLSLSLFWAEGEHLTLEEKITQLSI